jgi:hypothetical protein
MPIVLILGSGPNVVDCRGWSRAPFDRIVAINNAWAVRPDWDIHIHPEDFPPERRPVDISSTQQIITAVDYVPAQNALGGFVYGGGTMAFTASYWALYTLRPRVMAFLGCNMIYPENTATHFYGTGTADPLRADITLRSLEAKSARLAALAAQEGCALVNLSSSPSRLTFPRTTPDEAVNARASQPDHAAVAGALAAENALGYMVPSGRYWEEEARFDPAKIDEIDALWLATLR